MQQMPARVQDGSASDVPTHLQMQGPGYIPLCCPSPGTPLFPPAPGLAGPAGAQLLEINSHHFLFFLKARSHFFL